MGIKLIKSDSGHVDEPLQIVTVGVAPVILEKHQNGRIEKREDVIEVTMRICSTAARLIGRVLDPGFIL